MILYCTYVYWRIFRTPIWSEKSWDFEEFKKGYKCSSLSRRARTRTETYLYPCVLPMCLHNVETIYVGKKPRFYNSFR